MKTIDASYNELDDIKETCEAVQNWLYLQEATFIGNPIVKKHRYREDIIANSNRLGIVTYMYIYISYFIIFLSFLSSDFIIFNALHSGVLERTLKKKLIFQFLLWLTYTPKEKFKQMIDEIISY